MEEEIMNEGNNCEYFDTKLGYCLHKDFEWNKCKKIMCPVDPKSWTNIMKTCDYDAGECGCSHIKNSIGICNPDYCPRVLK
jgi:hypothetical protein